MKEYILRFREHNFFPKIYILLIALITFIESTKVVDIVGLQWYYLSIINSLAFVYVLIRSKDTDQINSFSTVIKNPFILFYSLFFLVSCLSLIFSINTATSVIALVKIINYLSILYLIFFFNIFKKIDSSFIIILFTISLLAEVWSSMGGYFFLIGEEFEYEFKFASQYLLGVYPNKNITAMSIAFKIPFAIILFFRLKNKIVKTLLLVLLTVAYFNLIILSARAIILSISISIIFIIVGLIVIKFLDKKKFNFVSINLLKYLAPIIISVSYSSYKFSGTEASLTNRFNSINIEKVDEGINYFKGELGEDDLAKERLASYNFEKKSLLKSSVSSRKRFYTKGLNYFKENPLMGSGIGNYQLTAIDMDSKNILSYVVPYVAHNDFIELLVETGFFGFLCYLLFILSIPFFLIKSFFLTKDHESRLFCLILSLPYFIYFIDSNINFPHYRPAIQISLILYSYIVFSFYKKIRIN